eukprot:Hpha_TRINITY_DN3011_c0_g1::TRINITY_DN3011_c0_g1_i1::g.138658::m.138658
MGLDAEAAERRRRQLLGAAEGGGEDARQTGEMEEDSMAGMEAEIRRAQETAGKAGDAAVGHAVRAGDIATSVIEGMEGQQQDLLAIDNELDNLQGQLKRAKRDLVRLGRTMATDKCIVCFTILVLLGICLVLGQAVFQQQTGGSEADPTVDDPNSRFADSP